MKTYLVNFVARVAVRVEAESERDALRKIREIEAGDVRIGDDLFASDCIRGEISYRSGAKIAVDPSPEAQG